MISGSISTSRKVACLTGQEALIFTWLIPWTDDDCRMEADSEIVKARIFPLRPEITPEIIHQALIKFHKIGLGIYYQTTPALVDGNTSPGLVCSYFEFSNKNVQTFHGIKKIPSILPTYSQQHHVWCSTTPGRVSISEVKLNEVKLNKEKDICHLPKSNDDSISDIFKFCQLALPVIPTKLNKQRSDWIGKSLKIYKPWEIKLSIMECQQNPFMSGDNGNKKAYANFEYIFGRTKEDKILKWLESAYKTLNIQNKSLEEKEKKATELINIFVEKRTKERTRTSEPPSN